MAELGFTITPKGGSIFTFSPPETMDTQKPLTLHRPHASRFERWKLLPLAKRLGSEYVCGCLDAFVCYVGEGYLGEFTIHSKLRSVMVPLVFAH